MNIKEAKEQIKNAMTAYFTKDQFGGYVIPIEKQRPIFLMGPPGIGKTAIMEQVASELGVGLVSYSMTHHTRQSALGLPFIEHKVYGGEAYSVSEYTMSEIIASVYDMMEQTGLKEGILFLDEINCVSETLAPVMLQFLQYKIFGRHRVPAGWIVVTAGNPPEYNNSVREFDIVTWDRLKRIDVEPDYDVWKEYAYKAGAHPAITTYLDIKKEDFYKIETTVDGKSFVTARGWSDLSDMMRLYEQHDIPVNEKLTAQYLQNQKIAKSFAVYYDLFNKYRSDYQVDKILAGKAPTEIRERAKSAKFDERLSLLGLLLDGANGEMRRCAQNDTAILETLRILKQIKAKSQQNGQEMIVILHQYIDQERQALLQKEKAAAIDSDTRYSYSYAIQFLEQQLEDIKRTPPSSNEVAFRGIKSAYDTAVSAHKADCAHVKSELTNLFAFVEDVFENGQEMLILVTEMTIRYYCAKFITKFGCDEYFQHNQELLFYERRQELLTELSQLEDL